MREKSITFVSPFGLPLLCKPPSEGAGGAERQLFLYGKALCGSGWKVVYITDDDAALRDRETVMPTFKANFGYLGGSKLLILWHWLSVLIAMYRADCNYYVIKTPAHLLAVMSLFTRIFRRKLVFWSQTDSDAYPGTRPFGKLHGALHDFGIKCADIIIAQNEHQVAGYLENYGRTATVIPNIAGSLVAVAASSDDNHFVDVLWAGNSSPRKRYEVVIELAKLMPATTFAMAMNVSDPARYTAAGDACSKLKNITFLGEVAPFKMEGWFSRCKLVLNTSRREGFPNTFLQAWQCGVPVVSLCINPDNVITKHSTGIVLNKSDDNDVDEFMWASRLAKHIDRFMNEEEFYQDTSNNAYNYIENNHGQAICLSRLLTVLSSSDVNLRTP